MGKKKHDTNHIGQIGVSWVKWVVEGLWGCGVEIVSAHNDNSFDVLIFLKRKEDKGGYAGPTGDVIFAQIKTGYRAKLPPATGTYGINLGKPHVDSHLPRWLSMPGPAIMINVMPPRLTNGDPVAYWTDIKNPDNVTQNGQIIFDVKRKIDAAGKGGLYSLCWRWAEIRKLQGIAAPGQIAWSKQAPIQVRALSEGFHDTSRKFYVEWMEHSKANPGLYIADVTNRGWRHMTRIGRPKQTMFQSLMLLPVASKLLERATNLPLKKLNKGESKTLPDGRSWQRYYEGVTARVTFYERQEAVIRVIVECTETSIGTSKQVSRCLYSVYELARRR